MVSVVEDDMILLRREWKEEKAISRGKEDCQRPIRAMKEGWRNEPSALGRTFA